MRKYDTTEAFFGFVYHQISEKFIRLFHSQDFDSRFLRP